MLNLDNCAGDTNIPVYSVVAGSLAAGCFLFFSAMFCFKENSFCYNLSIGMATISLIGHFGVQCWGSYIVFSKWQDWRYSLLDCNESTYLLSFSTLIIYWILWICCVKACKNSDWLGIYWHNDISTPQCFHKSLWNTFFLKKYNPVLFLFTLKFPVCLDYIITAQHIL